MEKTNFAAVMTGKGTGAISTIQVFGEDSESVIVAIFKPVSEKPLCFEAGEILLGTIHDGRKTIDQLTIGCEGHSTFAIHCHGNPLIVEMIVQLLQRHEVQILTDEQLHAKILSTQNQKDAIAIEAEFVQAQAKTIQGTKIILNQANSDLSKTANDWLSDIDNISIDLIRKQAKEILQNSSIAKLIIFGCKTILTGPPNTGKSTLLNCLAGKQKSIVSDISGTTRDWITAQCQIESMLLELVDTAGLDETLSAASESIDSEAQKRTLALITQADLILFVLDNSRDIDFDYSILKTFSNKKIITVLNKSDLLSKFNINKLPGLLSNIVRISAKEQTGIDKLVSSIRQTCNVASYNLQAPVCFTERQKNLLEELKQVQSKQKAARIITELLKIF
jgi:tRNA modification GTPase